MFPPRFIFLALSLLLLCGRLLLAETVNSVFVCDPQQPYSNAGCWSPPEVPNNTPSRQYNVSVGVGSALTLDVDAGISNLSLAGSLNVTDKTFAVSGTTNYELSDHFSEIAVHGYTAPGIFKAGTLVNFSGVLRGNVSLFDQGNSATLQFNGAEITALSAGLWLYGPDARVVDENGNDALRHLARVESDATLSLTAHIVTTSVPFTNLGTINMGDVIGDTIFAALAGLTNFDAGTRTLTGGTFRVGTDDGHGYFGVAISEFRFAGADVATNGSNITLAGPRARMTDLNGNDGLRNLARNLNSGVLTFDTHDFTTTGSFTNDGSLTLSASTFTITGALNNFDAATRTLTGGTYSIISGGLLRFDGADIVHNQASINLSISKLTDLAGDDGLRNFNDNQANGSFTVGKGQLFVAPGNFTNAGHLEIIHSQPGIHEPVWNSGEFRIPAGSTYTQTAGETVNNGIFTAPNIDITGGLFSGTGAIKGSLTVGNATAVPGGTIDGDLTLSGNSRVHSRLGQYYSDFWTQITGSVSLAGTLEIEVAGSLIPKSSDVFTLLQSNASVTGTFSNAPNGARLTTTDGGGSFVVVYETDKIKLTAFQPSPGPAQLLNISTRAALSRADDDPYGDRAVLIGGFIVSGAEPKRVVVRALGPSLAKAGVNPTLNDPTLELHAGDGSTITTNDNWRDTQAADLAATGLAPGDDREAALVTTLNSGSYTVVVRDKNGLAGTGLVEASDISGSTNSKLANISTRGFTDDTNFLIGGIIAGGSGNANAELVVRALGPQLRRYGIFNALEDPMLELRDVNGNVIAFNDDWSTNYQEIPGELYPPFSQESALRVSLPRGNYTAVVRAKAKGGGVALVEFYDLRQ